MKHPTQIGTVALPVLRVLACHHQSIPHVDCPAIIRFLARVCESSVHGSVGWDSCLALNDDIFDRDRGRLRYRVEEGAKAWVGHCNFAIGAFGAPRLAEVDALHVFQVEDTSMPLGG